MPISTFPRHDYYEDEYLLKPAGLRDTHSEGKVRTVHGAVVNRWEAVNVHGSIHGSLSELGGTSRVDTNPVASFVEN